MKILSFFKRIFCRHEPKQFIPKKLTTTERIASELTDMFGAIVGARHPVNRAVIYFDIITSKNLYTLEISHHEIHHNLWKEKAKKLLEEVINDKTK